MDEFCSEIFKEKLKKARKDLGLTQMQASKRIGIKRNTFARYETDTLPPLAILFKISQAYGISVDYLLDPNDPTVVLPPTKPKTVRPRKIPTKAIKPGEINRKYTKHRR